MKQIQISMGFHTFITTMRQNKQIYTVQIWNSICNSVNCTCDSDTLWPHQTNSSLQSFPQSCSRWTCFICKGKQNIKVNLGISEQRKIFFIFNSFLQKQDNNLHSNIWNPARPHSTGWMGTSVLISEVRSVGRCNNNCSFHGSPTKERRPLTVKVDKDDEVVILEVVTTSQIKVFDEVPPAPRHTSVAITGRIVRPHFGWIVPQQLSI